MNTNTKKTIWRYSVFLIFWTLIICVGLLLIPQSGGLGSGSGGTGTGTHGTGTGSGDSGSGSGKGTGTHGDGTGDSGNSPESVAVPAPQPEPVKTPGKAKTASSKQTVKTENKVEKKSALTIFSKNETSEDTATIFLPGERSTAGGGSSSGTSAGFFGIQAAGPVLFLLDTSGSMGANSIERKMSRIDLVKEEMKNSLKQKYADAMKNKTRDPFRIVTFNHSCAFFPEKNQRSYHFSEISDIRNALTQVNKLQPGGGTSMKLAWESIIPIIQTGEFKAVYFLSDGEPGDCSHSELLDLLKKKVPGMVIHTISLGTSSPLLQNIAKQHKGVYREVH